jgi:signal peptidase
MKPTFERGDLLIIRGVNPLEDVEIRDIIVFQKGQRTIVHRVIRIDENGMFVTRGDANPEYQTESVRPEEVRGEVVFVIPNLGHISLWVRGR